MRWDSLPLDYVQISDAPFVGFSPIQVLPLQLHRIAKPMFVPLVWKDTIAFFPPGKT